MIRTTFVTEYFKENKITINDIKNETLKYKEFIKYFLKSATELEKFELKRRKIMQDSNTKKLVSKAIIEAKDAIKKLLKNEEISKIVDKTEINIENKIGTSSSGSNNIIIITGNIAFWSLMTSDNPDNQAILNCALWIISHELGHIIQKKEFNNMAIPKSTEYLKGKGGETFADLLAWESLKKTKYKNTIKKYINKAKSKITFDEETAKAIVEFIEKEMTNSAKDKEELKNIRTILSYIFSYGKNDEVSREAVFKLLKSMETRYGYKFNEEKYKELDTSMPGYLNGVMTFIGNCRYAINMDLFKNNLNYLPKIE